MKFIKFLSIASLSAAVFTLVAYLGRFIPSIAGLMHSLLVVLFLCCIVFSIQDKENRVYFGLVAASAALGVWLGYYDEAAMLAKFNPEALGVLSVVVGTSMFLLLIGGLHVLITKSGSRKV